jgi:hypothetical protein
MGDSPGPAAIARNRVMTISRRQLLGRAAALVILPPLGSGAARAAEAGLDFEELYGKVSPLGLSFSDKVKRLAGQPVAMRGFMAPPLKAEANFFVLTQIPMSICPFCSTDSDWPDNIVVVYLDTAQTFEQANALIEVSGTLEVGSWTDPETGFVSLLRITSANFAGV